MELDYHAIFLAANELHQEGKHRKAFAELKQILDFPGEMNGDSRWQEVWHLFGSIAGAMGLEKLSHLAIAAGDKPDNAQLLYSLGYELIEVELPLIAATPLNQAHLLLPDNEAILSELSTAFENAGMYDLAYMHLSCAEHVLEESFMCRYLYAFNGIMSGHLEAGREMLPSLQEPPDENFAFMRDRIAQFVGRADLLTPLDGLDQHDLRGWHFVLTGSILLHLSPYGFEKPMRGRYSFVHDSYVLVREGIERVRACLHTWGVKPKSVVYFPDKHSEIIAQSLALTEGVSCVAWYPEMELGEGPILHVAYDLSRTSGEYIRSQLVRQPSEFLWAHALNWVEDFPLTPDFSTFMYEYNHAPWEVGGVLVSPEGGTEELEADDVDSVEDLIEKVRGAELEHNPIDEMEDFLEMVHSVGKPLSGSSREKYFQGSPVKSARWNKG